MKKITLKTFVLLFFVGTFFGFSQADCANALTLTPGTPQVGDTTGQAGSFSDTNTAPEVNPCSANYNDLEYWFSYTAVETGEVLEISVEDLSSNYYGVFIIDNCPDSSPTCVASDTNGFSSADLTVTTPALTAGTTYYIVISDWIEGPTTFTMNSTVTAPPACPEPSDLDLTSIGITSADIEWVAGGSETSWNLEWKAGADFVPGNAEEDASTSVSSAAFNPTGLTEQTEYYLYVQADCGSGDTSDWVGPLFFVTNECFTSGTFDYEDNSDSTNSVGFTAVTPGDNIVLTFSAGSTESCCDEWFITDVADGTGNVIASGFGSIVGSYESTSGEISFYVDSDFSVQGTTFEYSVTCVTPSTDTPDYFNVQFPATGTIGFGDEFLVFAQIYQAGLTDASPTAAAGIEAWIGYSEVDSSPDTVADWTWVPASTNPGFDFSQNNDEYFLDLGAEIGATGTYYYASRWSLNNGPFVYGGILPDGSNGGEWGTGGFASGVLSANPPVGSDCSAPIDVTSLPFSTSDDTSFYGDDYENGDSPCTDFYMSGDDVFYTYTPSTDVLVDVSLSNLGSTWSGIHVLDDCLDGSPNCVAFEGNSGSSDRILEGVLLNAGVTYYIVISTWATPQSTTYDLDISESSCQAFAGTLTADATPVSLSGGTATISATPNGDSVVPTDYDVTYVLTSGASLVIEAAGATPSFEVTAAGDYTIHTLVAETTDDTDPNYLDLSVIEFGVTTGGDVLGIVGDAGLCASLDVTGAPITVLEECTADAGSLTADATPVSLSGGTATISATPNGDSVVPTDYDVTYVLTSGASLVIEAAGATPSFEVTAAGDYTIHTLVAETTDDTDPNYLDLSVIEFGVTTGGDVLGIVGDAGLCASLDVTGAPITVLEECTADAGSLTADATPVSLSGGTATISATPNGDSVVPTDYDVTYVLTSGASLVIEAAGATPSFEVTAAGDYTIHTLVAETTDDTDPNYLDLSVIEFGVTTGSDVLGIVGGAGLCASLDVAGAPITVLEECTAEAGSLTADATPVSLSGGTVTISATPNGDSVVPTDYDVTYVLTSGASLVIEAAGATPSFEVTAAGDYTIHTLVAETTDNTDPNYLDLSVIEFGVTNGADVLDLIAGSSLCASLDVTGAPIVVDDELGINDSAFANVSVYPNPVKGNLTLSNSRNILIEAINIYDLSGRAVKHLSVNSNESQLNFDLSELSTGMYIMILNSEFGQFERQIIKE